MTAFDQFDPFEHRITAALGEIAPARRPDYLDTVLRQTARTSQRPRWTFPGRWVPVIDSTHVGTGFTGRVPARPMLLLLIVLLLAAVAAVAAVGSQNRLPKPFGAAANGQIAYASNGDIYVRDSLTGVARLLVGGDGDQSYPSYSPDGRWLSYLNSTGTSDAFMIALADGSEPRVIGQIPAFGNAQAAWAPDSRSLALVHDVDGLPTLSITPIDGSPAIRPDLRGLLPFDVAWRPPDGRDLLVRVRTEGGPMDLAILTLGTGTIRVLGLPSPLLMGSTYDLSGATWSPDGSRIAYNAVTKAPAGAPYPGLFRVHVVLADGSHDLAVPAPVDPRVQEAWPAFSPDGHLILVHSWTWKQDKGGLGWIAVLPADGSAAGHDLGPKVAGGQETGILKSWSPDGTRVLMGTDNTHAVYALDPLTGDQQLLDWTQALPDWQRRAP